MRADEPQGTVVSGGGSCLEVDVYAVPEVAEVRIQRFGTSQAGWRRVTRARVTSARGERAEEHDSQA